MSSSDIEDEIVQDVAAVSTVTESASAVEAPFVSEPADDDVAAAELAVDTDDTPADAIEQHEQQSTDDAAEQVVDDHAQVASSQVDTSSPIVAVDPPVAEAPAAIEEVESAPAHEVDSEAAPEQPAAAESTPDAFEAVSNDLQSAEEAGDASADPDPAEEEEEEEEEPIFVSAAVADADATADVVSTPVETVPASGEEITPSALVSDDGDDEVVVDQPESTPEEVVQESAEEESAAETISEEPSPTLLAESTPAEEQVPSVPSSPAQIPQSFQAPSRQAEEESASAPPQEDVSIVVSAPIPQRPALQRPQQPPPPSQPLHHHHGSFGPLSAPLPYHPTVVPSGSASAGADSSFWDMFSSSAPQAKVSRDLLEWAPDLSQPSPLTTLAPDWMRAAANLADTDRLTGHLPPYALRFGHVDELGEYHAMLEWATPEASAAVSRRRENKYTPRAREAARSILGSIHHVRVGVHRYTRDTVTVNPALATHAAATHQPAAHTPQSQSHPPSSSSHPSSASHPLSISPSGVGSVPPPLSPPPHHAQPLPDNHMFLISTGDGI